MTTITNITSKLTHADLNQFTGDLERYRHSLNRLVIYTPGVRYMAQAGEAYWLIDAIASYFGSQPMKAAMLTDDRLQSLQFWRLEVNGSKGILTAVADKGEPPFIRQAIDFTDFPLDHIEIWAGFDGNLWTLYLPSEH
jgi:hypothetical protein